MSQARREANLASIFVLVLLGASINLLAVFLINRFIFTNPFDPNAEFERILVGGASLAVLPFFLSILLTRFSPVGRIIPVMDIEIGTLALIFATFPYYDSLQGLFYGMFAGMGLAYASQRGPSFVSYPVDPEEVELRTMHVWMNWKTLRDLIESPDVGGTLGFDLERTEGKQKEVVFMRSRDATIKFFLRIVEHIADSECFVYMYGFEEGKYGMARTGDSVQYVTAKFDYLSGTLNRWKPASIKHEDDFTVPNRNKNIVDFLSGRVSGASLAFWRLSKTGWFLIGAVVLAEVLIPIYFYLQKDVNDALITIAVVLVSLVPIIQGVRKRKKEIED